MFQWEVQVHHLVLHRHLRAFIQGHSEGETFHINMFTDFVLLFLFTEYLKKLLSKINVLNNFSDSWSSNNSPAVSDYNNVNNGATSLRSHTPEPDVNGFNSPDSGICEILVCFQKHFVSRLTIITFGF